jgi:hypothetical protein
VAALLFNASVSGHAHAQSSPEPVASVAAFGSVGALGAIGYDNDRSDKLVTPFGFGAQFTYALHRYFALGVLGRYWRWRPETMRERFAFAEGAVFPRGQYLWQLRNMQLRVFVQVPVGLGWTNMDYPVGVGASAESTNSAVFVLGVSGGAELYVSRWLGVFAELGWLHHGFRTKFVGHTSSGTPLTARAGYQTDEALFQLGLCFALTRR